MQTWDEVVPVPDGVAGAAPAGGAPADADGAGVAPSGRLPVVTDRELSWEELVVAARGRRPDGRFAGLSDVEVEERLAVGASEIAAAMCRWLEVLAEFVVRGVWAEQGARTPGAWLAWKLGIAPSTAREHVRVALRLGEFPAVRARFAAGTLSYSKVRCLTRFGDPAFESMLLDWADGATAGQLESVARGFRTAERARVADAHLPDGVADRDVGWSMGGREHGDGTRTLTIRGPAEVIAGIEDEVARLAQVLVEDREGEQVVVRAADRVDALAGAVAAAAAAGAAPDTSGLDRHTLVVTVAAEDLLASDRHGEDGSGVVLARDDHRRIRGMDPRALRRLACDAGIVVMATRQHATPGDDAGSVDGDAASTERSIDVGRRTRRTTAALRRAVQQRDRGCSFPGCGATRHLHAHHVWHWADGGPTDLANLVSLCGFHHRFVHQHGWDIEVRADGRHVFRARESDPPVPRIGALPGASAEALTEQAPSTASAGALVPPRYDGEPFDLDLVVAVLQQRHRSARSELGLAA